MNQQQDTSKLVRTGEKRNYTRGKLTIIMIFFKKSLFGGNCDFHLKDFSRTLGNFMKWNTSIRMNKMCKKQTDVLLFFLRFDRFMCSAFTRRQRQGPQPEVTSTTSRYGCGRGRLSKINSTPEITRTISRNNNRMQQSILSVSMLN